jgi:hypothetical protein
LKVSRVLSLDLGDQYLQVVGELDPIRARASPETDTNDLKTINVYSVGVLPSSHSFLSTPNKYVIRMMPEITVSHAEMAQVRSYVSVMRPLSAG